MTNLSAYESAETYRLAAKGLGIDDICVKLKIADDGRRSGVRAIVLRKPMPKIPELVLLERGRKRGANSIHTRIQSSVAARGAPITLPRISILGDDQ